MTTHRARSYKRAIHLISELGPAKLHANEAEAIRDAADALIFSASPEPDAEAAAALRQLTATLAALVGADRILPETAERILDAVEGCGPRPEEQELQAAA